MASNVIPNPLEEEQGINSVQLIHRWLLEYSLKRGYSKILNEFNDSEDLPSIDELSLSADLVVTYTLKRIVSEEKFEEFPTAVSITDDLFNNAADIISFRRYANLSSGLKIMALFHMLLNDDKDLTAKTDEYFPRRGCQHPKGTVKQREHLSEVMRNFRHFVLPLISNRSVRRKYFMEKYYTEFRGPLPPRLQQMTSNIVDSIHEKMGLTDLEILMLAKPHHDLINHLENLGNGPINLLLDRVAGKQHMTQGQTLQILNLLREEASCELSPVDSGVAGALFQSSGDHESSTPPTTDTTAKTTQPQDEPGPAPASNVIVTTADVHASSVPDLAGPSATDQIPNSGESIGETQHQVHLFEDIPPSPSKSKRGKKRRRTVSIEGNVHATRSITSKVDNDQDKNRRPAGEAPRDGSSAHSSPFPRVLNNDNPEDWISKPRKEYGRVYRMKSKTSADQENTFIQSETGDSSLDDIDTEETQPPVTDNITILPGISSSGSSNQLHGSEQSKTSSSSKSESVIKRIRKSFPSSDSSAIIVISPESDTQNKRKTSASPTLDHTGHEVAKEEFSLQATSYKENSNSSNQIPNSQNFGTSQSLALRMSFSDGSQGGMPPKKRIKALPGQSLLSKFIKSGKDDNNPTENECSESLPAESTQQEDDSTNTKESDSAKQEKGAGKSHVFQEKWLTVYSWLTYNKDKNMMGCSVCSKNSNLTSNFAKNTNQNFRTSTLTRYAESSDHISELKADIDRQNFGKCLNKTLSKEEKAIMVALKCVFWLATEGLPLSKYPSLMKFMHDLDVPGIEALTNSGSSYDSRKTAVSLLEALSAVVDQMITKKLQDSEFATILVDESTDIVVHHKLVISAQITDPRTLKPSTLFLSDLRLHDSTGKGIFQSIVGHLENRGVSIKKVYGLGTDGASVMMGKKEGLCGQFLRQNPMLINTHCVAHRLALCSEQAAASIKQILLFRDIVEQLYYYFKKSPNKVDQMEQIQKVLDDPVLKYREVHQIRWLSFFKAIEAIVLTLDSLLTYFSNAMDPKARGICKRIGTESFIYIAFAMLDVLNPIMRLCLLFQRQDVDLGSIKPAVEACQRDLVHLLNEENPLEKSLNVDQLKELLTVKEGKLFLKGHEITRDHQGSGKRAVKQYINNLLDNLKKRFPNTESLTSMSVLGLRPITFVPENEVDQWGNSAIDHLIQQFGETKTHQYKKDHLNTCSTAEPIIDPEKTRDEWNNIKHLVRSQRYPRESMADFWGLILKYHKEEYPNLLTLANLALIHPVHTADCERNFSVQNQITTGVRNRITPEHCNMIMLLKIEGGDMESFDFLGALQHWRSQCTRVIFKK